MGCKPFLLPLQQITTLYKYNLSGDEYNEKFKRRKAWNDQANERWLYLYCCRI